MGSKEFEAIAVTLDFDDVIGCDLVCSNESRERVDQFDFDGPAEGSGAKRDVGTARDDRVTRFLRDTDQHRHARLSQRPNVQLGKELVEDAILVRAATT
jgi:hypothetical protein